MEVLGLTAQQLADGVALATWLDSNVRSSSWITDLTRLEAAADNSAKRYLNWVILNAEVFTPLGMQLEQEQLSKISDGDPQEIESTITPLISKLTRMNLIITQTDEKEQSNKLSGPKLSVQLPTSNSSSTDRAIRIVPLSSSDSTDQPALPTDDLPVKILPSQPPYQLPYTSRTHLPSLSEHHESDPLESELRMYEQTNQEFMDEIVETFKKHKQEQMLSFSPSRGRATIHDADAGDASALREHLERIFTASKQSLKERLHQIAQQYNADDEDNLRGSQETVAKIAVKTPSTVTPSVFKSHDFNLQTTNKSVSESEHKSVQRVSRSAPATSSQRNEYLVGELKRLCVAIDDCIIQTRNSPSVHPIQDVRLLKAFLQTYEHMGKLVGEKSRKLKDMIAAQQDLLPVHSARRSAPAVSRRPMVVSSVQTEFVEEYVRNPVTDLCHADQGERRSRKVTKRVRSRRKQKRRVKEFGVAEKPTVSSSLKAERRSKRKNKRS